MQPSVAWILFYVVIYLGVASGPCGLHRPDHDDALLTGVPRTRCTQKDEYEVLVCMACTLGSSNAIRPCGFSLLP